MTHTPNTQERSMSATQLGDIINREYQGGGDEETLRSVARRMRATLDSFEQAMFTDAVEMCGLWLDEQAGHTAAEWAAIQQARTAAEQRAKARPEWLATPVVNLRSDR